MFWYKAELVFLPARLTYYIIHGPPTPHHLLSLRLTPLFTLLVVSSWSAACFFFFSFFFNVQPCKQPSSRASLWFACVAAGWHPSPQRHAADRYPPPLTYCTLHTDLSLQLSVFLQILPRVFMNMDWNVLCMLIFGAVSFPLRSMLPLVSWSHCRQILQSVNALVEEEKGCCRSIVITKWIFCSVCGRSSDKKGLWILSC